VEESGNQQHGRTGELSAETPVTTAAELPGAFTIDVGGVRPFLITAISKEHDTSKVPEVALADQMHSSLGARDQRPNSSPLANMPREGEVASSISQLESNILYTPPMSTSASTANGTGTNQNELTRLRDEQARLQEKRRRIQELQGIEEQEERIRRRISEIDETVRS
jgi:hypothetical protein